MKLIDLNPEWIITGGEGITQDGNPVTRREGMGVSFDCPCGKEHLSYEKRAYIFFDNPFDGGTNSYGGKSLWKRTGDTFDNLTLTPSIQRMGDCKWHGFITKGEIIKS